MPPLLAPPGRRHYAPRQAVIVDDDLLLPLDTNTPAVTRHAMGVGHAAHFITSLVINIDYRWGSPGRDGNKRLAVGAATPAEGWEGTEVRHYDAMIHIVASLFHARLPSLPPYAASSSFFSSVVTSSTEVFFLN